MHPTPTAKIIKYCCGYATHYDDKHGAYASLQDQYDRAMTGTNKTLSEKGYPPGRPVNASKFF